MKHLPWRALPTVCYRTRTVECREERAGGGAQRRVMRLSRLRDPHDMGAMALVAALLLAGEMVLCVGIVQRIPYTEIDWMAYMQEVLGYLGGEMDYTKLKGDTGALVYPAGFVYVFSVLHYLTKGDVHIGQLIFIALYLLNTAVVFGVYARARVVPPWALGLLCLSKRVHSLFVLRLFNDCVAMLLAYCSVLLLQRRCWRSGLLLFSAAVSIKMNVLLFAPALLLLLCKATSLLNVLASLAIAAALQLGLAVPFLRANAWGYLSRSFDLGREFIFYWSVNFKFVPEAWFLSKQWAVLLLVLHLCTLGLFAQHSWCAHEGGVAAAIQRNVAARGWTLDRVPLTAEHITTVLFVGNFVGIVFARTLHFQFYCWYFHTIPYLLWRTELPTPARLGLWAAIEAVWNVFPSTPQSSAVLAVCHLTLLVALWRAQPAPPTSDTGKRRATVKASVPAATPGRRSERLRARTVRA